MDNRYQFQSWYIKLYRRIVHFPVFVISLSCSYVLWIAGGCKIMTCEDIEKLPLQVRNRFFTRYNTFVSIYFDNLCRYHMRMRNYYTTEDMLERKKYGGN